jgi:ribonuclease R
MKRVEVQAYQFYEAVMHSHARFTYTDVAAILVKYAWPSGCQIQRQSARPAFICTMFTHACLKRREKRGAVDFETTETQIICDDSGRIEKIVPRVRTQAHRLIEEAMLAANVCSADFILQAKHPAVFRVHEGPTPEKRETLKNYLKAMGVASGLSDEPNAWSISSALHKPAKTDPTPQQIHSMLLRSMQQAIYTPCQQRSLWSGLPGIHALHQSHSSLPGFVGAPRYQIHSGWASAINCLVYLSPGEAHVKLARSVGRHNLRSKETSSLPTQKPTAEQQAWEAAGLHCSANERRADEASRDVEAWLKCQYMREHLGEDFSGTVSGVTAFGVFVTLDAMYVEGLVHITELGETISNSMRPVKNYVESAQVYATA